MLYYPSSVLLVGRLQFTATAFLLEADDDDAVSGDSIDEFSNPDSRPTDDGGFPFAEHHKI